MAGRRLAVLSGRRRTKVAKIRHIAYRVNDVEAVADFFVRGLGMKIVQRRRGGAVDLSDGTLNITVLPPGTPSAEGEPAHGIAHIGFTVEDEEEAARMLEAAGATRLNTVRVDDAHYEVKYMGPENTLVDLGHWVGTAPIDEAEKAGTKAI
jgi:catechol 2,3-dioxygenase-like lactoylglutathione lyase family enzyme